MKATIDFSRPIRPIGKLNGMNNGPVHCFTDRTAEYKEMGVEFVRFHETHSYNTKCVELPFIFRDFDADENDPANYYFAETDAVMKAAVDAGIEIMYRLGMGTEGTMPRLFLEIPTDFAKWARVAEHIVAHYTEGWANGFYYKKNLRWLEIWNEADLQAYWPTKVWPEGRKSYIDFYEVTATYLKARFPDLNVGCCGWAGVIPYNKPAADDENGNVNYQSRVEFFHLFLARVVEKKLPLDFFAWHTYSQNSRITWQKCTIIRDLLAEYGLQDVKVVNSEWANLSLKRDRRGFWSFDRAFTYYSAVGTLGSMIVMQKFGNIGAAYYDADERSKFCLLYEFDGTPKIDFYPMKMWKWLKEGKTEVETAGDEDDFRICASRDGGTAVAALANEGEERKLTLKIGGIPEADYEVYLFDKDHALTRVRRGVFTGRALSLTLPKESAAILRFSVR